MYLPSLVIVGQYFDKRRALATGIATCGSGIGAFIFAPLSEQLIEEYAWKGAQWIIAAIVLNGIVTGAVYRPLTERDMSRVRQAWRERHKSDLAEAQSPVESTKLQPQDGSGGDPDAQSPLVGKQTESQASSKTHKLSSGSACMRVFKDILLNIKQSMDVSMLSDPVFVIYGLSCIFCMAGMY